MTIKDILYELAEKAQITEEAVELKPLIEEYTDKLKKEIVG